LCGINITTGLVVRRVDNNITTCARAGAVFFCTHISARFTRMSRIRGRRYEYTEVPVYIPWLWVITAATLRLVHITRAVGLRRTKTKRKTFNSIDVPSTSYELCCVSNIFYLKTNECRHIVYSIQARLLISPPPENQRLTITILL